MKGLTGKQQRVLEVIRALGYRKVAQPMPLPGLQSIPQKG